MGSRARPAGGVYPRTMRVEAANIQALGAVLTLLRSQFEEHEVAVPQDERELRLHGCLVSVEPGHDRPVD